MSGSKHHKAQKSQERNWGIRNQFLTSKFSFCFRWQCQAICFLYEKKSLNVAVPYYLFSEGQHLFPLIGLTRDVSAGAYRMSGQKQMVELPVMRISDTVGNSKQCISRGATQQDATHFPSELQLLMLPSVDSRLGCLTIFRISAAIPVSVLRWMVLFNFLWPDSDRKECKQAPSFTQPAFP